MVTKMPQVALSSIDRVVMIWGKNSVCDIVALVRVSDFLLKMLGWPVVVNVHRCIIMPRIPVRAKNDNYNTHNSDNDDDFQDDFNHPTTSNDANTKVAAASATPAQNNGKVDILSPAAMENAYYICHNVQVSLLCMSVCPCVCASAYLSVCH